MRKLSVISLLVCMCYHITAQTQIGGVNSPIYYNLNKVLINSISNNCGQLQILNPQYDEASMAFIGKSQKGGNSPISLNGESNIWVLGCSIWGEGGHTFGIGNRQYAADNGDGKMMTFKSNGNIGLGTVLPKSIFHVEAKSKTGLDGKFLLSSLSSSYGQVQILNPLGDEASLTFIGQGESFGNTPKSNGGDNHIWVIGSSIWGGGGQSFGIGNRQHFLDHGNGRILTIQSNGNVGIGNNSPSYSLDVTGIIRATEIKVEAQTADFVFEDNYQLKDLSEVEQFITSNKHLPDIPSAKQMEENGVGLSEMNKLLLQKVEELTLYVIELKKENERCHTRIDSLVTIQP